ncbi:V-type ATPase subunit [Candidatus Micrarchaeota archaeon]|nr:V-type ATPase subunit [Candidatus Micrarchaeota archaeon]
MDLGYAYANARIKGMRSNLLDENAFRELMQVKTLDEVTALLEQTPYKQDLVEASKNHSGVHRIDVALHSNQARVIAKLSKILPAKGKVLFAMLASEWDAQNLKLVFSKKHLGQEIAREELMPTGKSFENFYAKLIAAKTLGEALEFAASKWGSRRFKAAARELAKKPDLKGAIAEIDAERARQLVLLAKNASDPLTRKIVEQQLAFENAMAVLRLKKEGVKNAEKFVVYKNGAIAKILQAQDFDEAVKQAALAFSLTPEQAAKAKESLALLEIALERKTVNSILALTKMSVMSFATAIGFVYLKKVEVSNLRKIAYANAFGLKQELGQYVFAINA